MKLVRQHILPLIARLHVVQSIPIHWQSRLYWRSSRKSLCFSYFFQDLLIVWKINLNNNIGVVKFFFFFKLSYIFHYLYILANWSKSVLNFQSIIKNLVSILFLKFNLGPNLFFIYNVILTSKKRKKREKEREEK
jgi:hypothetical protein